MVQRAFETISSSDVLRCTPEMVMVCFYSKMPRGHHRDCILKQAWANPGFLGADILQTQDKSTTIHKQIIANLYYVMKLFADIRNYIFLTYVSKHLRILVNIRIFDV